METTRTKLVLAAERLFALMGTEGATYRAILAEAGMTMADVVRFTAYVTDRAYFPVYGAVRSRYVAGNAFASTLVIVSGFTRPEFKVEVEVTAVHSA